MEQEGTHTTRGRALKSAFFYPKEIYGMPNTLKLKRKDKKRVVYQIVVIGAGANGSHFFRGLCQDLSTHIRAQDYGDDECFSYDLTIADGDIVEEKNLNNQLFDEEDIGLHKVVSLAERYGDHYDIPVKRVTSYVKDEAFLGKLFPEIPVSEKANVVPVLVGMVDNVRP
jgi:molybdopterin/thiamine biosynthesis adenylyltransferase